MVVGDLFGPNDDNIATRLIQGEIQVPITTYFTVGANPLPPQVVELIEKGEDVRHVNKYTFAPFA